jgi:hypothetical protein
MNWRKLGRDIVMIFADIMMGLVFGLIGLFYALPIIIPVSAIIVTTFFTLGYYPATYGVSLSHQKAPLWATIWFVLGVLMLVYCAADLLRGPANSLIRAFRGRYMDAS